MERGESMSVIDGLFRAMNEHDVERMGAACTPGVVYDVVATPEPIKGVGEFKSFYADLIQGYPDMTIEVTERYMEGDTVICQVRWRATNSGVFQGAEPTGKKVDLRIAYFFEMKDGKIDSITEYYDLATLLTQQGQLEL
jgi:steroid delta-isomerase-like uncharacterized protein